MTVQTKDQSILKWKNTAHITKAGLQAFFAIAAIAIAATTIYAAAKGIALSSVFPAFLANPWVIATIAFVAAAYLIATAISSYQQIEGAKGQDGQSGQNGKDADFSALLGDAIIKSGTIVAEGEQKDQLFLILPISDYKALAGEGKKTVHVLLAGKKVEFQHKDPEGNATEYKVKVTKVDDKAAVDDMKKELGMTDTPLKVAVSNKGFETLKGEVPATLQKIVVEGAIRKAIAQAA